MNQATLGILLRYLRAFCDDDQPALVRVRAELGGFAADPAGALGLIGGYPVDPQTGEWRPLAQLRRLCREWGAHVPEDAPWWPDLFSHTRLCLPEQDRPGISGEVRLAEQAAGLFPAMAAAPPPTGEYPYWPLRPTQSQQFTQDLDTGRRPSEPLAACAYDLIYEPAVRSEFLDELDRFRARLSNAGQVARALDYAALIEFFGVMTRRSGCRPKAATLLFRALKAAVYHRAGAYLDRYRSGHRALLHRLEVRLGDTKEIPELAEVPTLAVWLHVHDAWIEPVTSWAPLVNNLYRPSSWTDHLRLSPGVETAQARRLAVLFELAFADVAPDPGRGLSEVEAPLADLLPEALVLLLACDQEAGDQLIMAKDILNGLGSIEDDTAGDDTAGDDTAGDDTAGDDTAGDDTAGDDPGAAPRKLIRLTPRQHAPEPPKPHIAVAQSDARHGDRARAADLVGELRTRLEAHRDNRAALWVTDADRVFEFMEALTASKDGDRHRLMRRFAQLLLAGLRQEDRYPEEIQGMMDSLNPLVFALASTGYQGLEPMLAPTMRYLLDAGPDRDPGPYAALLLRAITIVHSKHHRYAPAEQWLGTAWRVIRPAMHAEAGSAGFVKQRESVQQVTLQASGMYMRILEFRLADPAHPRAGAAQAHAVWGELRLLARLALGAAGFALNEVTTLDDFYGLPDRPSRERASSHGWAVHTRCMYMRALLLQATLEAVQADRRGTGERGRQWERERVRVFMDVVPRLYAEATSRPLSQNNINELTRTALHYAFLSAGSFLTPGTGPTPLPAHLRTAKPVPGPDGTVESRFDLDRASQYLLDQGHDAGILASITHPEVRAALERRSVSRPAPGGLVEQSLYRSWLETEEWIDKLRRAIRLERMPRGVGVVAAQRRQMGQDWANWRWAM